MVLLVREHVSRTDLFRKNTDWSQGTFARLVQSWRFNYLVTEVSNDDSSVVIFLGIFLPYVTNIK